MKVKVKTLTGVFYDFDVEPTDTVMSLKEKVAAKHDADVNCVRLAFSGHELNGADTIEASRVKDGDVLVAVIRKGKPVAKPAPQAAPKPDPVPEPAPQPAAPQPAAQPAPQPAAPEPAQPADQPAPQPAAPQPAAPQPAAPHHHGVEVNEAEVEKLVAMGFPRDECVRALRLAYNNSDRAVQFLLEGFPEGGADDGDDDGDEQGGMPVTSAEVFRQLTANPQFQMLRARIQQDPSLLQIFLTDLQNSNPLLYGVIMDNREAFSQWLSGGSAGAPAPSAGTGAPSPAPAPAPAGQPLPRGPGLAVSAEDRAAIQNLVEMGFNQEDAVNAYFACDKNLQLAANFLMENGGFNF